jgi:hypothetical protein
MTAINVSRKSISKLASMKKENVLNGLSRGRYGLLVGPPGAGKGYFLISLAFELATGKKFIGMSSTPKKVMYWPTEDGIDTVSSRLEKPLFIFNDEDAKRINDNFFLWDSTDPICNKSSLGNIDKLVNSCLDKKVDLLIIDTLRESVGNCHEVDDDLQIKMALQRLAIEANVAILIAHHPTKEIIKNKDVVTSVCGSGLSLTQANSRYTLFLSEKSKPKSKQKTLNIKHVKANNVPIDSLLDEDLHWSPESLLFTDIANYKEIKNAIPPKLVIKKIEDLNKVNIAEPDLIKIKKVEDITNVEIPENYPKMVTKKPALSDEEVKQYERYMENNNDQESR